MKIIECVPNFSEGRNKDIIDDISKEIKSVSDVLLLDIDMGYDTNRTVVTFAGAPDNVIEAAFLAIKKSAELIDMRKHKGEHSRMGATDVCPLIPISDVSMNDCIKYSNMLAERVANELSIQVYMYEKSAKSNERINLANIRKGEYEKMKEKTLEEIWTPDYGPAEFNDRAGVTAIGARNYLIAYNVNLNTKEKKIATDIALDIREAGRAKRDKNGKILRDKNGLIIKKPGTLKNIKAVGWYIDEYDKAQVSINIINYLKTPIHKVFEEVRNQARKRGLRVTGSEIVGLIPKDALITTGRYYLKSQNLPSSIPEKEIINIGIDSLGLNEISPFDPNNNIVENRLSCNEEKILNMTLEEFADEISINSPAPGGGSVSAFTGCMASSLVSMVSNLSYGHKKYLKNNKIYEEIGSKAQIIKSELLKLVDEDTEAFNGIMQAFRLPKRTSGDIKIRNNAIDEATKHAIEIPLQVMRASFECLLLSKKIAKVGNVNSLSDAGVASEMSYSAVRGAYLNVLINLADLNDKTYHVKISRKTKSIIKKADIEIQVIRKYLSSKLNK